MYDNHMTKPEFYLKVKG